MAHRIIRPKEAQAILGIKSSKFWLDVKLGVLPPLVHLGPRSRGMLESDLVAHIERLRAAAEPRSE
jgi:predicted DNA-binding transcriptional regulator AlpA